MKSAIFGCIIINIPVEKKIVLSCFGILEVVKRIIIQDVAPEINIHISGTEGPHIVKIWGIVKGIDRNLSITVEIAFILSNSFQKTVQNKHGETHAMVQRNEALT